MVIEFNRLGFVMATTIAKMAAMKEIAKSPQEELACQVNFRVEMVSALVQIGFATATTTVVT